MPPTSTAPDGPLLRALASSSTARRRAALAQLKTYLSSARRFSASDMLKIWKALFYTLYMTPRPRNQQRLSQDISDLPLCFAAATEGDDDDDNRTLFLQAFWTTIAREWPGLDRARLDKFLYLVRRMVGATFSAGTAGSDGEEEGQTVQVDVAARAALLPLAPRDTKIPDGLRLHVLDVLVDELARAGVEAGELQDALGPVRRLQKESLTKSVRARASEVLSDERLEHWGQEDEETEEQS